MIFIGYDDSSKAYRLIHPVSKKLIISRDVIFDEESAWKWGSVSEVPSYPKVPVVDQMEDNPIQSVQPGIKDQVQYQESVQDSSVESPSSSPVIFRNLDEIYEECDITLLKETPVLFQDAAK